MHLTPSLPPAQPSPTGAVWRFKDLAPALLAGLMAVLISYAGPLLLVLQAAQAGHLTPGQTSSWVWAVSLGAGLCGAWLSWTTRQPVICAWNTPGAALLLGSLAVVPYAEVIGAYLAAAAIMVMVGHSGWFERLMQRIPQSLCAALLAGILMRFALEVFANLKSPIAGTPGLVVGMFGAYLAAKRWVPRCAIALTLLTGVLLWVSLGWGQASPTGTGAHPTADGPSLSTWITTPLWTTPEWSASSLLSVGLPLLILALTGQQMPGVAVMRTSGYQPATSRLVAGTGWASLLLAPFGSHGVNLAAITAAICTGPEAHPQPERRWVAGVACGVFYVLLGTLAAGITQVFGWLPAALVSTVAGLALLGAIQNGLSQAMQNPSEREAALITFVVTASNISLLGLGSACWGMALGCVAYWVLKAK